MTVRVTAATAQRVLWQIRHDPRTIALLLIVPCFLLVLLRYVFDGRQRVFQHIGAPPVRSVPVHRHVPRDLDNDATGANDRHA